MFVVNLVVFVVIVVVVVFFNNAHSFLNCTLVSNSSDLNILISLLVVVLVVVTTTLVVDVDVDVDVLFLFNIICQILALACSSLSFLAIKFLRFFFVFISSDFNTAILFALMIFCFCSFL